MTMSASLTLMVTPCLSYYFRLLGPWPERTNNSVLCTLISNFAWVNCRKKNPYSTHSSFSPTLHWSNSIIFSNSSIFYTTILHFHTSNLYEFCLCSRCRSPTVPSPFRRLLRLARHMTEVFFTLLTINKRINMIFFFCVHIPLYLQLRILTDIGKLELYNNKR